MSAPLKLSVAQLRRLTCFLQALRMSVTWDFVERCYRTRVTCAHHQYDLESRQGSEPVMACTKCGEEQA